MTKRIRMRSTIRDCVFHSVYEETGGASGVSKGFLLVSFSVDFELRWGGSREIMLREKEVVKHG